MTAHGTLLRAITGAVDRADDGDDLRERVCDAAVDACYDYAYLYDDDRLAFAGRPPTDEPADTRPETVETVEDDGGYRVLVPVADGDDRLGTLAFGAAEPPDAEDRAFLLGVGETVGHGIATADAAAEHARVESALKTERRQFEKLHSVAAQMVGRDHEQSIYHLAIDAAENILDFDICGIDIAEDGYLVPKALSTGMESGDFERYRTDEGVAGETFQENKRIVVDDVAEYADADPTNPDYRSVLSVPIGDLGVFQAASERVDAFSDRDAELAELLMAHVAETLHRLRSDEALRESEAKYRTLIEQSHDAVAIFRDGRYEFVNNRAAELFGRDEDELLAANAWDLIHNDDREKLKRIHDEVVEEVGRQRTFDGRIWRPSGDVRYCEFSVTSIDYEGETAALASIRDITQRKERERELERQNERLDEFASVVSHDLRSPINVARGSIDLVRQTDDGEHLDRAEEALDRMENIVEDVLELARQGQHVDETEPVELSQVASDSWESVDARDATLDVTTGDCRVAADPGRLRELFENLFRNAVEHGGDGVAVTVECVDGGFAVTDDGAGVPAGMHDEVFERGYTSADDGTGFGLAIVENIAEAHDWSVDAVPPDSGDDDARGARFEVTGVTRVE
ncbi:sensor histidine kinase [Halobacterium litoreum]|uniref:histidine kinase n=1 Tax=Halobacterium litoreum TaxID=2039234 RepID=A0ABD5NIE4_9EURY|nr:PAS domain S-box protein [Halobacterium litoreum]UHH12231.1 PAS domain S-box protein [Halobacterium litoreum]